MQSGAVLPMQDFECGLGIELSALGSEIKPRKLSE